METADPSIPVAARVREIICAAIAATATEENKWVGVRRIQKYFQNEGDIEATKIGQNLLPALKDLERQEILVRKGNSFTFLAMETAETPKNEKKKKWRRSDKAGDPPKDTGPNVVLTSSGRVSIRTST
jgi:hypothetical protein